MEVIRFYESFTIFLYIHTHKGTHTHPQSLHTYPIPQVLRHTQIYLYMYGYTYLICILYTYILVWRCIWNKKYIYSISTIISNIKETRHFKTATSFFILISSVAKEIWFGRVEQMVNMSQVKTLDGNRLQSKGTGNWILHRPTELFPCKHLWNVPSHALLRFLSWHNGSHENYHRFKLLQPKLCDFLTTTSQLCGQCNHPLPVVVQLAVDCFIKSNSACIYTESL